MLINYLKSAIRNFLRYKVFAIINIASLTIGIIGCLAIGLFVSDELQYDRNIPGGEDIYRIYEERIDNASKTYNVAAPPAYATFLKEQYPEVDETARILMSGDKFLIESNDARNYEEKGWFTEASFLDIFPLEFVYGNPLTALEGPNTMIISQDMAERYFGKQDPVGKVLKLDKSDIEINGVFKNLPDHFHLDFNYLISLASAELPSERMQAWGWHQFYTYVKLKPGSDVKLLQDKLQTHIKKEVVPKEEQQGISWLPYFQSLKNIHLQSAEFTYDNAIKGNETYVKALTIIALFVLVIACFNFINLATARSFKRAREIGIRKVVGAYRRQLFSQFIGETILLAISSMIIAMIAILFIVPWLNRFTGKSIEFNPFANPLQGFSLLAGSLVIGTLAGIYPAMILSGFKPVKVLKSMKVSDKDLSSALLRKSLVVIQFALSVLLIVCTIIVYRQTQYFNKKDLGFNKEQVLEFMARGKVEKNLETFIAEIKRSPNVVSATSGYGLPGDMYAGDAVIIPGDNGDQKHSATLFIGDFDYIKTLGLRIIAGRDFSKDMSTDVNEAFIINETAVREFGFGTPESAIGKPLYWDEWEPEDSLKPVKHGKVIGVVQDFHYKSLHEKVSPSVIQIYPQVLYKIAVKLKTSDTKSTIAFIEEQWNKFSPEYPFDYQFMDESYGKMYKSEEKLSSLLWIFAVMAIVVGCMGLFALAALSAEERTKEIGIRKAMGAKAMQIMALLSGNFLILITIASVIAVPIAWLTMSNWLQNFSYRTTIEWWIFLLALLITASIALITISFQTLRVALMKPVRALRTD
jgi:putative ABC transport system permease protein